MKDEESTALVLKELSEFSDRYSHEARGEQIARCAKLIETLIQGSLGDSSEAIVLLRTLTRLSGESCDHRATVDFASLLVLKSIAKKAKGSRKGKLLKGHLDGGEYRHEHMYPCDAAMKVVLERRHEGQDLLAWLSQINLRSLIDSKKEEPRLNDFYKSSVPVHPECASPALSRYCATGLLDDLRAVSPRGKEQLKIVKTNSQCLNCSVKASASR